MYDFIAASQNLPFTVALGVMLGLALLEVLLLLLGGSLFGFFDGATADGPEIDMDAAADGLEIDTDGTSVPTLDRILGWFAIGRVPLMVVVVAFLTSFGLLGLILQSVWSGISGFLLPTSLAIIPALIGGASITRWTAVGLARLIPSTETSAVSTNSFVGRVATITLGSARLGQPAQAKLQDQHGQTHYVMVEPDRQGITFEQGSRVLLVARARGVFRAIKNKNNALID